MIKRFINKTDDNSLSITLEYIINSETDKKKIKVL